MRKSALKITIAAIALLFCFSASAQEQGGMKVLTIQDDPVLESPLTIEVYLYGKKIKSDVPFKGGDGWIGDLQIFVTNRTDDPIKYISFALDFPTEHNGEPMTKRFRIGYGKDEAFKIDDNPDAEERKIGKKESAVVTFNSSNPLASEGFENFKRTSRYDQKTWDHGILSVYAVEFENRSWLNGIEFDKRSDGTWEKNKAKEHKLIERIKAAKAIEQIGFLKRSFLGKPKSTETCWTVPPPPNTGINQYCTAAANCEINRCRYFSPTLVSASVGFKKVPTSPACKTSGTPCNCCEPNVDDLGAICSSQ
jgi:hypothetical protein